MPKNVVASVHMKYKRRLYWLVHALNIFIDAAETKLDPKLGGNIRHREKIEQYLLASKELAALLPERDEIRPPIDLGDDFLDRLANATPVEEILAEGRKFFSEMDPDELEEMKLFWATMRAGADEDSGEVEAPGVVGPHWLDQFRSSDH